MLAKTPRGKIWRKRKEGLHPDCTAKGAHTGSGGKVLEMFVAISYGKGVIFCEEYEQYNGDYFANFIRTNFSKIFQASRKRHSKLFVQDNCPIQNCAKARKALKDIRAFVVRLVFSHTLVDSLDMADAALPIRLLISASRDRLLEIVEPR